MRILETVLTGLLRLPWIGKVLRHVFSWAHRVMAGAMKRAARNEVRPRHWSNTELRRLAPVFKGRVINVSGWKDGDKEGGHYKEYFKAATSYTISNYYGERGLTGVSGELFFDLENELPEEFCNQFDVAFNHTVLEHVYDIRKAVANICALSRDVVILVTPFLQHVHYEAGSFGDYWRPTPACLERMLGENGFSVIYQSCNDNEWFIVYVLTIASRRPEYYRSRLPVAHISPDAGVRHFCLPN
jgi:hypothetical protein